MLRVTSQYSTYLRKLVQDFPKRQCAVAGSYTLDDAFVDKLQRSVLNCPLVVLYGHQNSKKHPMKNPHVTRLMASHKHGRQHAKFFMMIGQHHLQLTICTANLSEKNKRSQNVVWTSPLLPLTRSGSTATTRKDLRRCLQRFFHCFSAGVKEQINGVLQRSCGSSLHEVLDNTDFSAIPSSVSFVMTTPPDCSTGHDVGLLAHQNELKRRGVKKSELTTFQPTSFGAHLDADFWKTVLQIAKSPSQARIVVPKLCVYSKIQRQRLKAVPVRFRSLFEDLVWKPQYKGFNELRNFTAKNVPHFKLYYGSDVKQTQVNWMFITSMSFSQGACGRWVCPNNMYAVHTNKTCKCKKCKGSGCTRRFVGRNFELGVLVVPRTLKTRHALANLIPYY